MRIDRIMMLLLRKWLKLIELHSIFVEHILIYSFKFTAFEYFVTKFNGGDGRHLFRFIKCGYLKIYCLDTILLDTLF